MVQYFALQLTVVVYFQATMAQFKSSAKRFEFVSEFALESPGLLPDPPSDTDHPFFLQ